ncbi:ATP-dependent DNA helicase [Dasania sp. GY-MA-18]|uniref:ATP-dependent DNA helicase n=1 Tax=Dasania phycosphaerae TaxID=2950436 RepID=A0A9J6RNJ3_9GAMM|nr:MULTISPECIES: ATP-dependent DNA helicase [Dasania]MCR8923320.1 ATP-dependent DNA helicase [Dasania sp. GY-MA-18]MCZ0865752.1 ATP-dependent DNA helicase [Dasania phycosphaerae]MCZ0869477.1 ATP-dependent DNA helicase [Dasania phycosphaerae]
MKNSTDYSSLLGEHGLFAQQLSDFVDRPGQLQMAEQVGTAISQQQNCAIEAPSGLGKTWGYLIPALLSGKKTLISTAGHYLQKQLYLRDIPQVQQCLGLSRSVALLKGRSNYLCPYYLKKHIQAAAKSTAGQIRQSQLSHIYQQLRETGQGDISALGLASDLRPYLTCAAEECLAQRCPDFKACPLYRARSRAEHADVVIVNHSLLLSYENTSGNALIAQADTVVVDEAHRLLALAQQSAGHSLSSRQLRQFIRQLLNTCQRCTAEDATILRYLSQLQQWLQALTLPPAIPYQREAHLHVVQQFIQVFKQLLPWFNIAKERDHQLTLLATQAQLLYQTLQAIVSAEGLCWVQKQGRGFVLQNTPVHVLDKLKKTIAAYPQHSWILTSATLSTGTEQAALASETVLRRTGLTPQQFHRLASPFNYARQARLYLPAMHNSPEQKDFYQEFSQRLAEFIALCPGRVLVLFSSYRALNSVAEQLELAERSLLQQARPQQGGADNYALLKQFIALPQGVLLATGAFWEGVDLSGAPLSAVVMDKLPFSSPTDPLSKLRSHYLQQHGVDSFNEFMLPEAIIKFRQGCGRLLRREGDKGVIMLADNRLHTKPYGQRFLETLASLPQCQSLDQLAAFFNEPTPKQSARMNL